MSIQCIACFRPAKREFWCDMHAPPSLTNRRFGVGDKCDCCPLAIRAACLPCNFGGCAIHMAEHDRTCPVGVQLRAQREVES